MISVAVLTSTRRSFFAALLSLLAAKFLPKPQFESGVSIAYAYREDGHTFYKLNFPPVQEYPQIRKVGKAFRSGGRLHIEGWQVDASLTSARYGVVIGGESEMELCGIPFSELQRIARTYDPSLGARA